MKALPPHRPVGLTTGWLTPGTVGAWLLITICTATAQEPTSVQLSDTQRPDSQLVVRVIKPSAPAEPAREYPVEQTVYWPEVPADPPPSEDNLLTKTGRLLRRVLDPITPPGLRPKTTNQHASDSAPTPAAPREIESPITTPRAAATPSEMESPKPLTPQGDAIPAAARTATAAIPTTHSPLPRRAVLGENSVSSLDRVLLAQQRFEEQTARAVPDIVPSEAVASSRPAAPPNLAALPESVTPRTVPVDRVVESLPPSFVRLTSDRLTPTAANRFVRGPDGRLIRVVVNSSRHASGTSALPSLPRHVKVDELAEFLAARREALPTGPSSVVDQTSWPTSAGQSPPAGISPGDGLKPIQDVRTDAQPEGDLPENAAAERFALLGSERHGPGTNRDWTMFQYWWQAPDLCHSPLYYEEINLERYGYSHGILQPAFSAAHFFGVTLSMPYLMTASPPSDCQYTLGHYRPGSYAPAHFYRPPFSLRAGAAQAAAVTGLIFLAP
ncbi:MAG: hypothetical protein KJ000_31485 [Pirellulaceae bacterium]|nr:hypothetical protein [Pirellulaceae bacterium]